MISAVVDVWLSRPYTSMYTNKFFIFNICCFITKMHFGYNLSYPASHHMMSFVSWPLDSSCVVSYWWPITTIRLSCTVMEIWSLKYFGVTTTFWGHVTSSVTWPLNSACVVSYWWSIVTMRLSCTVMEIWSLKHFGVTTLSFLGHVTLSVPSLRWPFDCGVSYRWSMVMHAFILHR